MDRRVYYLVVAAFFTIFTISVVTLMSPTATPKSYSDSGKIVITPGAEQQDLNFCWYSGKKAVPAVKVSKTKDFSDFRIVTGTAKKIKRKNWKYTYNASNRVAVKGYFTEEKTYYYCYTNDYKEGDDSKWSEVYSYTVSDRNVVKAVYVSDPQIGASGTKGEGTGSDTNIKKDTGNWNKILNTAYKREKGIDFIMSSGDLSDYYKGDKKDKKGIMESEYAGLLYPALLRNIPFVSAIGNHDNKGESYKNHFFVPNKTNYGRTLGGTDFYFSYGNVLFIVINGNSMDKKSHEKAIRKAVSAYPDAKWRIALMHQDIYGSGYLHSNRADNVELREKMAPLFEKYDVDVCFGGHDHSYCRSYPIVSGKPVKNNSTTLKEPDGTIYIATGTATGSKYYAMADKKQDYVAVRKNKKTPTYSIFKITEGKFIIDTYTIDDDVYVKNFTIEK